MFEKKCPGTQKSPPGYQKYDRKIDADSGKIKYLYVAHQFAWLVIVIILIVIPLRDRTLRLLGPAGVHLFSETSLSNTSQRARNPNGTH